jgi:chromosome segregation ATPase
MAAAGEKPSANAVRSRLKDEKGSYSTILRYISAWNDARAAAAAPKVVTVVSDGLAKAYAADVEAQVGAVRDALGKDLAIAIGGRDEAEERVREFEAEVATLTETSDQLRQERDQVAGRLAQLEKDAAAEVQRLIAAESTASKRANDAERSVAGLEAKLEAALERAKAAEERETRERQAREALQKK